MTGANAIARPVLVHRTMVRRLLAALFQAIPSGIRELWRGPAETLSLEDGGGPRRALGWSFRPVNVVAPADAVLQQRLTIPRGARRDLGSAVELFVAHKTPFGPRELLIHAIEETKRAGDEHASYIVRAIPRALVEDALRDRKIGLGRIGRIGISGMPDVDFAPALRRGGNLGRWSFAIPVAATLTALGVLVASDLSMRADRLSLLEAEVSDALARVRVLSAELGTKDRLQAGLGEVSRLLDETPSAYLTLAAVRQQLPETAEISKVDLRGREARLTIRAPNVLAVVQALNGNPDTHWTVSVDGPITADAATGREAATILLRGSDA